MSVFDWLTSQKVVKYGMICDYWLANLECLFPGESSIKIHAFGLNKRKISNVHTEGGNKKKKSLQELKPLRQNLTLRKIVSDRKTSPARYLICLSLK